MCVVRAERRGVGRMGMVEGVCGGWRRVAMSVRRRVVRWREGMWRVLRASLILAFRCRWVDRGSGVCVRVGSSLLSSGLGCERREANSSSRAS